MNVFGMFVKHPLAGEVKTRLAADIGEACAADLYAAFVADLADRFRNSGERRYLCYAPAATAAEEYFSELAAGDYELWPQPNTALGDRLAAFFEFADSIGAERTVVIGSDSPTLPADFLDRAFDRLASSDCVVGPASDGGYYLIGQRGRPQPIFDGIDWSGPHVLSQTIDCIERQGMKPAILPVWYDVDSLDDLHMLRGHLRALQAAGSVNGTLRTARVFERDENVFNREP
ncbi:MAG: TIGR04282 family arsenosugar biosynthesis glycosyltransferase [Planctomycetes bacterium]|nr:TIGR04282 family arsenosugar biosynthesis glycosyltransferase [Planctomycetota bacterium]